MSRRKPLNPNAKQALDQMKYEIATGLGIDNVNEANSSNLTSRQIGTYAGSIGAEMTKRLVKMGEEQLINEYNK